MVTVLPVARASTKLQEFGEYYLWSVCSGRQTRLGGENGRDIQQPQPHAANSYIECFAVPRRALPSESGSLVQV